MKGTPKLGALVAELGRADTFARDVAVFLAGTAQDIEVLRPFSPTRTA